MKNDFCMGCQIDGQALPQCILYSYPTKVYIEDVINNTFSSNTEIFVCNRQAQEFSSDQMVINSNCNDCQLCYISCKAINAIDNIDVSNSAFESLIFNNLDKAFIAFKELLQNHTIATEVHVEGNFRTKRIDLVTFHENTLNLIKLLKTTDKLSYYARSYQTVLEIYKNKYPNINFRSYILVPSKSTNLLTELFECNILTIKDFIQQEVQQWLYY